MKLLTNAFLGLVGGAVGLAAMAGAQKLLHGIASSGPNGRTPPEAKSISLVGDHHAPNEPATEALARTIYEKVTHRWPGEELRRRAGTGIHLAFGSLMALGYGLVRGHRRGFDVLGGLVFGVGVWIGADLLGVSLLGLTDSPTSLPLRKHAAYLGAHVAYGVGTAAAAQAVGKLV